MNVRRMRFHIIVPLAVVFTVIAAAATFADHVPATRPMGMAQGADQGPKDRGRALHPFVPRREYIAVARGDVARVDEVDVRIVDAREPG